MFSIFAYVALSTWYRLSDPLQYQSIVDAEWNIIYDKLDKCVQSGAKIVLSRLAIGDLATQVASSLLLCSSAIMPLFCILSS
jgi:T-complex protein 1 subunit eta